MVIRFIGAKIDIAIKIPETFVFLRHQISGLTGIDSKRDGLVSMPSVGRRTRKTQLSQP